MTSACLNRPRPRPRLVTDNTAPARPPLISSEAQRNEAKGVRPYARVHLKPKDLPSTYMPAVSGRRKSWRPAASIALGVFVGLAALGLHGRIVTSLALGAAATLAVALSDGWAR